MPTLMGHPRQETTFLRTAPPSRSIGIGGPVNGGPVMGDVRNVAIDGTPIRMVALMLAAGAGLFALRVAGFKFNVGVSN